MGSGRARGSGSVIMMTNAQVALQAAAATFNSSGNYAQNATVLGRAAEFKVWLDEYDQLDRRAAAKQRHEDRMPTAAELLDGKFRDGTPL